MALVEGTNCGFVTAAPVADPGETAFPTNTGNGRTARFTSPAGNNVVTEMGWWQHGDAHVAASFNMGIYADDGSGDPGYLITTQNSGNETTENTPEWCVYTGLNIQILPSTVYHLAFAVDAIVSGAHWYELVWDATQYTNSEDGGDDEVLPDPFVNYGSVTMLKGIYAVYEAVPSFLLMEHSLGGNVLGGNVGRMTE